MKRREVLKKVATVAGSAAVTPTLLSLLQSCQSEDRLSWTPRFLSPGQAQFVSSFVDTVLPATDTPGALDVKADMFIDLVYSKLFDEEGQKMVSREIEALNNECIKQFGDVYADLDIDKKKEFLSVKEKQDAKFNRGVWGTAVGEQKPVGYYRSLKSMTLWAYFSSEEVGKNILNYDPVPGTYQGCIPVEDVGNIWSL